MGGGLRDSIATSPQPEPQPEVGSGMGSAAQEPKCRAVRRKDLNEDQFGVQVVLLELQSGVCGH